ncbi:unnamed protein product, partial [Rotaria sp. Silwood1]
MLMNSFGSSRKRPIGCSDKENIWSSMLGIEIDSGVATKQPRLALGSAMIDNNIFNSIPYSPPDNFFNQINRLYVYIQCAFVSTTANFPHSSHATLF